MRGVLSSSYVQVLARAVVGTVFIVASIDKIAAPDAFAASIEAYHLVPYSFINLLAMILPWMELFTGAFLIGGVYLRASSLLVSALLGVFIMAIVSALLRGFTIDCGCFGKEHAEPVSWTKVGEDIFLLLLSFIIYRFGKTSGSLMHSAGQSTNS